MRRSTVVAVLSLLSITAVSRASGQVCAGTAPFSAGAVRISGISQFENDTKMFAGGLTLGAPSGPFGGVYVGQASMEDVEDRATTYGGHLGFSAPVGTANKLDLCPMATVDRLTAKFDFGGFGTVDLTGTRYGVGLALGGVASTSATFDFIPFASVAYNHAISESSFGGTTEKLTDDFGLLTLGAGFVFNKVVTIQPNVLLPFGLEDSDPAYGITIAFNFGKKN